MLWADVSLGQNRRWWYGVAGNKALKVRQVGEDFEYAGADEKFVTHYFSLDVDLKHVLDSVNKDVHMDTAIKTYWGLRMIRQDPWECLISYICATYKSIPAIRHMLNNLPVNSEKKQFLTGMNYTRSPTVPVLVALLKPI